MRHSWRKVDRVRVRIVSEAGNRIPIDIGRHICHNIWLNVDNKERKMDRIESERGGFGGINDVPSSGSRYSLLSVIPNFIVLFLPTT